MSRAPPKVPPWFATGGTITLEHTQMTLMPPITEGRRDPSAASVFHPSPRSHGTAFDDSRTFDLIRDLPATQAHACRCDVDYPARQSRFLNT